LERQGQERLMALKTEADRRYEGKVRAFQQLQQASKDAAKGHTSKQRMLTEEVQVELRQVGDDA